jgi:hypothetical protein
MAANRAAAPRLVPMTRLTASPPITAVPLRLRRLPLCPSGRPFDNGLREIARPAFRTPWAPPELRYFDRAEK